MPPRQLRPGTPPELGRIVLRCLAKKPEDRYASAAEVRSALRVCEQRGNRSRLRRPLAIAAALIAMIVLGTAGTFWYRHIRRVHWAETTALPEAERLIDRDRPLAAMGVLRQAERVLPSSPSSITPTQR